MKDRIKLAEDIGWENMSAETVLPASSDLYEMYPEMVTDSDRRFCSVYKCPKCKGATSRPCGKCVHCGDPVHDGDVNE